MTEYNLAPDRGYYGGRGWELDRPFCHLPQLDDGTKFTSYKQYVDFIDQTRIRVIEENRQLAEKRKKEKQMAGELK